MKHPSINHARAFALGIKDGFNQPYDVSSSANVDHLEVEQGDVHNTLDMGINIGQAIRAGKKSQAVRARYWPFNY